MILLIYRILQIKQANEQRKLDAAITNAVIKQIEESVSKGANSHNILFQVLHQCQIFLEENLKPSTAVTCRSMSLGMDYK